ncbi:hypothetical protein VE02_10212, partial [Pseudogymnoascus sp. 03VT05]
MLYAQVAKRYMTDDILFDIRNWIPQYLELDTSEKEKYALFVDDLCNLQHGNWVQELLLMDFGGCISLRPKALVGKRPLLYSDITFHLFPPTIKGKRPIIVMTLNLKHIKRSRGKSKKKKFTFYEGEDLSCCAVSFMLALALANNAFKNEFKSLRDIYNLVVPLDADRITLKWDDEWAEQPIFRDVEVTANGYAKYRYYFVRLGRVMGYEKALELYGLRRGSGKELNDALTPEERRHIIGNSGDVYERYYMPDFVDKDCQGIYLGTPRRDDLIRRVGRLARHGRCPSSLTDEQKLEIKNHPDIVKAAALHKNALLYKNETIVSVQQIQGLDLTCDLCKSDEEAGPAKKDKVFKRIDILRKH